MYPKELHTENLTLRPVQADDTVHIHKGLSNPEVVQFYGVSYPTLEDTKEQMEWYADLVRTRSGIWFVIEDSDTHTFFGAVGLNDMNVLKAELGCWVLPEFWGRGIAGKAIRKLISYAFEELNLQFVEGFVETENHNCIRLMEKLGFTLDRTMIDSEKKGDRMISLHVFILRSGS